MEKNGEVLKLKLASAIVLLAVALTVSPALVSASAGPPSTPSASSLAVSLSLGQTPYGWMDQYPSSVIAHVTGGIPPYTYHWFIDGFANGSIDRVAIPGVISPVLVLPPPSAGAFIVSVEITDSSGHSASGAIMVNYGSIDFSPFGEYVLLVIMVISGEIICISLLIPYLYRKRDGLSGNRRQLR